MSRDFYPVYSSVSDGSDITLCRILEAVSLITPTASNSAILPYTYVSTSGANATIVKSSSGRVFNFIATNASNQTIYVKFYDKATTPNPTSDSPDYILPLQKAQTITLALGVAPFVFHNGISFAIVTSATGDGSVSAGDAVLSISWI